MNDFIPVNQPLLDGNEKKYLQECIDSGWISSEGPFVKKFEESFASRAGRRHGIAVTNGTAALEAAVRALDIGNGDEVIMPSFTIISCAAAIVRNGAVPVVVDCLPDTWNMDVSKIESKITRKTKAIMAVHIYGLPVDMDPLLEIARKHGLKVIEDAAEAIGLTYKGRQCGSMGDVSVFSFYPNKHVTTGEGGMILTDSTEIAEKSRSLRDLCFIPGQRFVHKELGWNLRMTNMQAALGVAQLERLDVHIGKKREIGRKYDGLLRNVSGIQIPLSSTDYAENIYWVFGVVLADNIPFDAKKAMDMLAEAGIGTRPYFWPMHEQPVLREKGLFKNEKHPVSENIARRGFYVPSGLAISDGQIQKVADSLVKILS
ncbi:MAG TPA: aminotransferase DegT [Lentisphaeria bacterium]|nr:MAG: aminotransferase DegT [Lentisphaerae bacterium GWF2_50_93]HCE45320.1 aminotransferase DegT [Lentisphaeria bacterium]